MRVDLPREQWAEFRDLSSLTGGDAKAVRRATKFRVEDGTLREITMGLADDQMDALLGRVITSWDVRAASGEPLGLPMYDKNALDAVPLDTYDVLTEAAAPYMDAVTKAGKAPALTSGTGSTTTSSPSGPTPPILQGSAISPQESSTTSSNGDGTPNDGAGLPPSQSSSPLIS